MAQVEEAPEQDEVLSLLSVAEATYVRELAREAWKKHGHQVTVHPDHLVSEDGGIFGLWSLAADCRKHPMHLWPRIVADQIAAMASIDPTKDFFAGMSEAAVLRNTYLRLQATAHLPDPSWYPYARQVAPGILELIGLYRRRATMFLRPGDIERFGGLERLRQRGLGNLRILPVERRELVESPEGGHFRVLQGESSFTASRLLTLDRLLDQLFSEPAAPNGVLAAMPSRNEVAIHILRDPSALPSLVDLTWFAYRHFGAAPGPLSPSVYWIHDGQFQQVTACDIEGVQFQFSPEFQAMMDSILALGDTDWAALRPTWPQHRRNGGPRHRSSRGAGRPSL